MDSGRGSQAGQRGAKPAASASLSGAGYLPGADRVACYDMMAHVSLSLMYFVSAELG